MATKKKTSKKATVAEPQIIVKRVVTYTDPETNEVKEFDVPENIPQVIDCRTYPQRFIRNGFQLLVRIDSFEGAWTLMTRTWPEDQMIYSIENEYGPSMGDDCEWNYDYEDGFPMPAKIEQMYEWLKNEFEEVGHVYFISVYDRMKVKTDDDGDEIYLSVVLYDDSNYQLCSKGAFNYTAKYEPGKNMFYHHDNNRAIRASRIDELIIRKKAGYNTTVTYSMADGNSVKEADVCTPEMAHEWINSKS